MTANRIVVGMSGGVDSSVAALLLKQQGYDVLGLFMKNWEDDDTDEYCTSRADLVDAVAVADSIGIDIDVVNFSAQYKERVFSEFLAEYRAGRTPNPDVLCNAEIKFRCFLDHAMGMGAKRIATGHYARTSRRDGNVQLLRGLDSSKDQSYFLYRLQQSQLEYAMFPIGHLEKSAVRSIAREHGLSVHAKRDSTGICFIGERPFRAFLNRYLPTEPGDICNAEGETIGRHVGLMYYTIGQRQGLGIGGRHGGTGTPWYVARKEPATNRLIAVQGHDHPLLLARALVAIRLAWTTGSAPARDGAYSAKTRYRQADSPCRILGIDADRCLLEFEEPQWAVTPGQSVVLYQGEVCLGGGIIETAHAQAPSLTVLSRTE
ncbi:MAG: tRNA 2-thiouridine(34) synthase MnmA [Betaproteobacteria bacterium]|nr:MAG: tRNA 2-thiouridine(34) synthase MnmA [Betaproteobacteria bacterium]